MVCYYYYRHTVITLIILSLSLPLLVYASSSHQQQGVKMVNDDLDGHGHPPLEARLLEAAPNTGYSSNPGDHDQSTTYKLDISSGQASIDLGPIVVNEDGE